MTDDELVQAGRELAEACGFDTEQWGIGWYDNVVNSPNHLRDLATDEKRIREDCYPVLDARFGAGKWELSIFTYWATEEGGRKRPGRFAWYVPLVVWRGTSSRSFQNRHESLPYALNRACYAALTEGK